MLIDKLPDAANLALGALVFGQLLADRPFSPLVAILGAVSWVTLIGGAFWLGGKRRPWARTQDSTSSSAQ